MNDIAPSTQSQRCKKLVIIATVLVLAIVMTIVVVMNIKHSTELQDILADSIKSQLISISVAARSIIDVERFDNYWSEADVIADQADYDRQLAQLRQLADNVGAQYIYALKRIGNEYMFVFDTDSEDESIFIPYELSPVHQTAFEGTAAADVLNVEDLYGTFNTGAVPIWKDNRVIGIICTDISDVYLQKSLDASRTNMIALLAVLLSAIVVITILVSYLLRRVGKMQQALRHLAHHDIITGLPNRQYLLEYLANLTRGGAAGSEPFALLFIDLDNFKMVNDNAGHEAGDKLLRHIGIYLQKTDDKSKSFRPTAGRLNIAARIGGDEFIQIVSGISTAQEAGAYAQRLLDGFTSHHFDRYIDKYKVGLSIGIALYPYHTEDFHVLIQYADTAMYYAKRAGKNQYRVYEDEMGKETELPEQPAE